MQAPVNAEAMAEHISKGMYGVIIVDPAEGYSDAFPAPDREYVLVQGDLFADGASPQVQDFDVRRYHGCYFIEF